MARQQRFDWFLSQQRSRRVSTPKNRGRKLRKPRLEQLEVRRLLSVNPILSNAGTEPVHDDCTTATAAAAHPVWYVPKGETLPPDFFDHHHETGHNHDSGCCCDQCLGADETGHNHDPGCCCDQCLAASGDSGSGFEEFTAFLAWDDQDPAKEGHQITYSYSNLFDGGLPGGLTEEEMRLATEESFMLWASVTPLNFIEVVDSGLEVDLSGADNDYPAENHPNIRIGHHFIDGSNGPNTLAHAYFPPPRGGDGQAGDVHFDNGNTWSIGLFLETMIHELGHSLGLGHEPLPINGGDDAIMNPIIQNRFNGLGEGMLLQDDIDGIQSLYGASDEGGSVEPLTPFQVNTLDDVDDTMMQGDELVDSTPDIISLREALKLANFAGDGRRVTFAEELFPDLTQSYTIDLDAGLGVLDVTAGAEIVGPGSNILTVAAADASSADGDGMKLFNINNEDPAGMEPDTVAEVTISGMSLVGGDSATAGGAIFTSENLTLIDTQIYDNYSGETGGAVYSTGLLTVSTSTLRDNRSADDGGAIDTTGGAHIDSSTLSGNDSGDKGGAIAAEGLLTEVIVTSSTLSGNSAAGSGGAIHIFDDNPRKFRVLHSTIFENSSGASGGGIFMQDGVLALEHSIVGGNTDTAGAPDLDNVNLFDDPRILARYSLIENANGAQITQQAPNLIGVAPLLSPLSDNGGPTLTHEPMSASLALNGGNPNIPVAPDNDQRGFGFQRIFEGVIDIGAVESGGFEQSLTVNSLLDKSDLNAFGEDTTPDEVTLREAVLLANLQLGRNLINFDPALNGGTIDLSISLGEMLISDSTTIDASDLSAGLTINAGTTDPSPMVNNGSGTRIIRADDGDSAMFVNVELIGLTLTGGDVTGDGGAIHSVENLILRDVSAVENYAIGNGGGVYHRGGADGGTLLIESSTLASNEATLDGGGLWSNTNLPAEPNPDPDPNPITGMIINSTVSGNTAGDEGGGVMNFDGQLEIRHATITENEAVHGSGVVSFGDALTKTLVYSSIISGNVINENDPNNSTDDTGFDVQRSRNVAFNSFESLGYNLIGTGNALPNFNNNDLTEVFDPRLGPLSNNGGKTQTHQLLSDSPALDSSEPPGAAGVSYREMVLALNPTQYWTFDEATGSFANLGGGSEALADETITRDQPGGTEQTGRSVFFDGGVENQITNATPALDTDGLGESYSISFWLKATIPSTQMFVFELEDINRAEQPDDLAQIHVDTDGTIEFGSGANYVGTINSIVSDQWHNVVIAHDSGGTSLYLDGVLDQFHANHGGPIDADSFLFLGEENDGGGNSDPFVGSIDDFVIFDQTLAAQEVSDLFDAANAPLPELGPESLPDYDQRGEPFDRVADGDGDGTAMLDIGAVERATPEPSADFNNDGDTDGSDFLAWQRGFGSASPTRADGDSNADGSVDSEDLANWLDQYGEFGPTTSHNDSPGAERIPSTSEGAVRSGYRPAITAAYRNQEVLFAAAQDYYSRGLAELDDHAAIGDNAEAHQDQAPTDLHNTSQTSLGRRVASLPDSQSGDDDQSNHDENDSRDRAFASIGVEQPVHFRGL